MTAGSFTSAFYNDSGSEHSNIRVGGGDKQQRGWTAHPSEHIGTGYYLSKLDSFNMDAVTVKDTKLHQQKLRFRLTGRVRTV